MYFYPLGTFSGIFREMFKEKMEPPGRYKHLKFKSHHHRPITDSDRRHKNLLVRKRRNKKKLNKRSREK